MHADSGDVHSGDDHRKPLLASGHQDQTDYLSVSKPSKVAEEDEDMVPLSLSTSCATWILARLLFAAVLTTVICRIVLEDEMPSPVSVFRRHFGNHGSDHIGVRIGADEHVVVNNSRIDENITAELVRRGGTNVPDVAPELSRAGRKHIVTTFSAEGSFQRQKSTDEAPAANREKTAESTDEAPSAPVDRFCEDANPSECATLVGNLRVDGGDQMPIGCRPHLDGANAGQLASRCPRSCGLCALVLSDCRKLVAAAPTAACIAGEDVVGEVCANDGALPREGYCTWVPDSMVKNTRANASSHFGVSFACLHCADETISPERRALLAQMGRMRAEEDGRILAAKNDSKIMSDLVSNNMQSEEQLARLAVQR